MTSMLFVLAAAVAAPVSPPALTCAAPVSRSDTAASLRKRFGKDARMGTIDGAEGMTTPALLLWPNDPRRRLAVLFADEGKRTAASVLVRSARSLWRAEGLGIGTPLSAAATRNGRPIALNGFEWDYGGYVTDYRGGRLAKLPGGCNLSLRFGPTQGAPLADAISGDRTIRSDDPKVQRAKPTIEEITVNF